MKAIWAGLCMLACCGPAFAQDERDLCPDRPGLGTPACTVEPGRVVAELGVADWTHDRSADIVSDEIVAGDALVRIGVTESLEAQVGWTAFGHVRELDRASGRVERQSGVGDVTLALRQNLRNPDGSGLSLALMPYATLPTGGSAIGAGDWGAGLIAPVSVELGALSFALTPEIDAAVDEDGHGRHLAFGSVLGLGFDLSDTLSATVETALTRDRDPAGHVTQALAGLSLAWQSKDDVQFDIGANAGLNHDSPDVQLYIGIARRF
jgi:hypothetical protein